MKIEYNSEVDSAAINSLSLEIGKDELSDKNLNVLALSLATSIKHGLCGGFEQCGRLPVLPGESPKLSPLMQGVSELLSAVADYELTVEADGPQEGDDGKSISVFRAVDKVVDLATQLTRQAISERKIQNEKYT